MCKNPCFQIRLCSQGPGVRIQTYPRGGVAGGCDSALRYLLHGIVQIKRDNVCNILCMVSGTRYMITFHVAILTVTFIFSPSHTSFQKELEIVQIAPVDYKVCQRRDHAYCCHSPRAQGHVGSATIHGLPRQADLCLGLCAATC